MNPPGVTSQVRFPPARGDGLLTGRVRAPERGTSSKGTVVLCHPHPSFGGNMDVWLLPTIGAALAADGWTVLRFNFRSVHTGVRDAHDDHADERDDLAGAINYLRQQNLAPQRLALVGWSFGALIALLHGLDEAAVDDWVGIAPPTIALPELPMAEIPAARIASWSARRTVIVGQYDQFFPVHSVGVVQPHHVHVLENTDHFFFDLDHEVAALVVNALREPHQRPVSQ